MAEKEEEARPEKDIFPDAGEDSIDRIHPGDGKIRIKLTAPPGGRKQTDWKKTAYDTFEAAFEVLLGNHTSEDVVVEPIPGDWKMLNSSSVRGADKASQPLLAFEVNEHGNTNA